MTHVQGKDRTPTIKRKDNPVESGQPTWAFYKGRYQLSNTHVERGSVVLAVGLLHIKVTS